ncbi:MAG: hypothetical protein AAFV43_11665 [Planctomycetota bacterium]
MAFCGPSGDGDVLCYNLSGSGAHTPRLYFVNGIRVLPNEHAVTAAYLSLLLERPIWGVYNKTAGQRLGSLVDFGQCLLDYAQNASARMSSHKYADAGQKIPDSELPAFLDALEKHYVVWNDATAALFRQLVTNRRKRQLIVAHSQGNLITSNALFAMEKLLGASSLKTVRVYSLASPSPAWPLGLRHTNGGGGRQDNAFMNDLVALLRPHNLSRKLGYRGLQNDGHFETLEDSWTVALRPHDSRIIIERLNFLKSIRNDLGLSADLSPELLAEAARLAEKSVPKECLN